MLDHNGEHHDWRYAANEDIEIRLDLVRPETAVQYRTLDSDVFDPTPIQSATYIGKANPEWLALEDVYYWILGL